jgi:hypothetical protein
MTELFGDKPLPEHDIPLSEEARLRGFDVPVSEPLPVGVELTEVADGEKSDLMQRALEDAKGTEDRPKANLGLATTAQLLEELKARIEIDYYSGGGGLQYTTVGGRPEGPGVIANVATEEANTNE